MTTTKQVFQTIRESMTKAFFASAFADQADESGNPLRGEIMDQLPDIIDPAAYHAADTLISDMINAHVFGEKGLSKAQAIDCLFFKVVRIAEENKEGDRDRTPENFGHYCAMQAMGHGVGLSDAFGNEAGDSITVPYVEFGSHSLSKDYF